MATKADRYEGIDGLKAYAIIGIALMHILANGEYGIGGFVFERLIPSFTNLVFLFIWSVALGCAAAITRKLLTRRSAWRISTRSDTLKSGRILYCFVR